MSKTSINELIISGLIIIPSAYFIVCHLLSSQEYELENKFKIKMNQILDQKNYEIRSLKNQHADEVEKLSLQIIQERDFYEKKASIKSRRTKIVISALINAIDIRNRKLLFYEINE